MDSDGFSERKVRAAYCGICEVVQGGAPIGRYDLRRGGLLVDRWGGHLRAMRESSALGLSQAIYIAKDAERHIQPHTRWELSAVAVSLAERGSFADPYMLPTGPTAHLPPLPPAISALAFRIFGLTIIGGYVAWLVNMAIFASLWGMLPWLAGSLGLGRGVGSIGHPPNNGRRITRDRNP